MSKRLVNTFTDGMKGDIAAKVYYDAEYSEYTVKMYYHGKHYEIEDYFTGDKTEAFETAKYAVANNTIHDNIFEKAKMKQSDTVRDNMLITMIENAINDATKTRANKDYSRVNGYLGYAQGVIETALKVKAITALRAKQYKAEIKRIVMQ